MVQSGFDMAHVCGLMLFIVVIDDQIILLQDTARMMHHHHVVSSKNNNSIVYHDSQIGTFTSHYYCVLVCTLSLCKLLPSPLRMRLCYHDFIRRVYMFMLRTCIHVDLCNCMISADRSGKKSRLRSLAEVC